MLCMPNSTQEAENSPTIPGSAIALWTKAACIMTREQEKETNVPGHRRRMQDMTLPRRRELTDTARAWEDPGQRHSAAELLYFDDIRARWAAARASATAGKSWGSGMGRQVRHRGARDSTIRSGSRGRPEIAARRGRRIRARC